VSNRRAYFDLDHGSAKSVLIESAGFLGAGAAARGRDADRVDGAGGGIADGELVGGADGRGVSALGWGGGARATGATGGGAGGRAASFACAESRRCAVIATVATPSATPA
jgi:hypothetical protein